VAPEITRPASRPQPCRVDADELKSGPFAFSSPAQVAAPAAIDLVFDHSEFRPILDKNGLAAASIFSSARPLSGCRRRGSAPAVHHFTL
jgi:hypothetical protein